MPTICPTITASNSHEYRGQVEQVESFIERLHIDLADGEFAPSRLVNPIQVWWPENVVADIHVMYQRPIEHLDTLIALSPNLVILHAESEQVAACLDELRTVGIKTGVALLPGTQPEAVRELLFHADHCLIFGGHLGYHGGKADLKQLEKADKVLQINADIELSWDGGANAENIVELVEAGIEVVNVGSFVQKAEDPKKAYGILKQKLKEVGRSS